MKSAPRPREESITNPAFLRTMLLTGLLTAGVAFGVFLVVLRSSPVEVARSYAFSTLVFAELLRSFGARSDSRPVWRIPFLTNPKLLAVVAVSLGFQVWSGQSAPLRGILKTSPIPLLDGLLLLALGTIPLLVLEMAKLLRRRQSGGQSLGALP